MLRFPKNAMKEQIIEIPRFSPPFLYVKIPLGGAFLRIYPFGLMMHLMNKMNQKGFPFMLYIHPSILYETGDQRVEQIPTRMGWILWSSGV